MTNCMKAVIPYYKKRGETPKEALERLSFEKPYLKGQTLSYAGRLDPLAEGLLLVLVGDSNKERERYLSLQKTYVFDVLFGFSTDTYDIAGKLTEISDISIPLLKIIKGVASFEGVHTEAYPPYSSKPVQGKPLFVWAREGRLSEITIPTHTVEIKRASLLKTGTISGDDLYASVQSSLESLTGDFRQQDIWACWEANLEGTYLKKYQTATIEISCGSGTYVRSLVHNLGKAVGVPALTLRIVRTSVGDYTLRDVHPLSSA